MRKCVPTGESGPSSPESLARLYLPLDNKVLSLGNES